MTTKKGIAILGSTGSIGTEALEVIEEASRRFPDSFDVWKVLASLQGAPKELVAEAKTQMKRLDPHNPALK